MVRNIVILLVAFTILFIAAQANAEPLTPPVVKEIPKEFTIHGDKRIDNYFWLRDISNPDVMKYIEAENKYADEMMKHTEKLQQDLYSEMIGRIKENDISVPEKIDNYYYYSRMEKGKQYAIYCRKKDNLDAQEEILLDVNTLAVGHDYMSIGVYKISPNHQFLAYSTNTDGSETYTIYIKDLNTGKLFKEQIPNTYYSLCWAVDNNTIFYTTLDDAKRSYKLYRHTLGTDPKNDVLIYHEKDQSFSVSVFTTKDRKYLMMNLESNSTSETRYLDAKTLTENFKILQPREQGIEYFVAHHENKFYIITNENAKNFKLMEVSDITPLKNNWKELISHSDSVKIDDMDVFKNYLVVYERENGLRKIRIMNLTNNETYYIDFPEPVYTFWQSANKDFNSDLLRFNYTSLITPVSVFDYNMKTKTRELKKKTEVIGYEPTLYQSERIFAKAVDGTMIPISLVYKKGMKKNGNNPLFLYSYGSYGDSTEPEFYSDKLSLLNRGFIYAIAHIRGGQEMGREWYEKGKLLYKKNTFTDFIACAEHLIAEKYTTAEKLVINGGSAGGLLMGAVTNIRPDLFKVVIAEVPFVDVINTMLDPSLPLTVEEYEEWGNPDDKKYYDYMKSYSPYDNVIAKNYPNLLITAGLNDPRVKYWEPLKWTAKLRALKTDKNILLIKTNMGAGHGGASGRYEYLKEIAFQYAFIFDVLGIPCESAGEDINNME